MLTLSRMAGQAICIAGRLITVRVAKIDGNRVRLQIDAPRDVQINREEVQDRIDGERNTHE